MPLVLSDKIEELKRTKEAVGVLKKLKAWSDIDKVRSEFLTHYFNPPHNLIVRKYRCNVMMISWSVFMSSRDSHPPLSDPLQLHYLFNVDKSKTKFNKI